MYSLELVQGTKSIRLHEAGFYLASPLKVSSPEIINEFSRIDGRPGRILGNSSHEKIVLEAEIEFDFSLDAQYPMLRDQIMAVLSGSEPFYIREMVPEHVRVSFEKPGERTGAMDLPNMRYANGKQYLVIGTGSQVFEQIALTGKGTATFETAMLPYAESIGTSKVINDNGVDVSSGIWSFGMGLQMDGVNKDTWKYKYSDVSTFNIYNPGHVDINDWKQYCQITITAKQSASSIRLVDATGGVFILTRDIKAGDVIKISQPYVKVNDATALHQSNYYFPVIKAGQNAMRVEGISYYEIEFDFKFYYGAQKIKDLEVWK
ncbi:phage tail domain-containing protein [Macrococcus brunensis]|uniref:phage tail domain-containing protein n=1 Tax=Macrococcus brunensis TaxID=198483 RepID=UPI001EF027BF|nr:phage tail domain-containing protein [Macrococcus brunensis]ULG73224.1 phage tail family protein [Macrococcus brunensis]